MRLSFSKMEIFVGLSFPKLENFVGLSFSNLRDFWIVAIFETGDFCRVDIFKTRDFCEVVIFITQTPSRSIATLQTYQSVWRKYKIVFFWTDILKKPGVDHFGWPLFALRSRHDKRICFNGFFSFSHPRIVAT